MIPPPSPHPSQAVERIREILLGRQLGQLELRLSRLEETPNGVPTPWEDRLCATEARLEALQETLQRMAETQKEETKSREIFHREEIQRIVAHVQNATAKPPAAEWTALEQKIGTWLNQWHAALQTHLAQRDQRILADLRQEMSLIWENTENELTRVRSQSMELRDLNHRLQRIAEAARALAEAAIPRES